LSFFNFSAKDDWKIDNSSGVQKCGFYGNNSLILTTECRQTKDCFYWYQQVLPTNGSTACKLAVGSLGSCCPQVPKVPELNPINLPEFPKESNLSFYPVKLTIN
jgi:hypothetical protein